MKYDAVLEGGGVKINALVGSLAAIEHRGFEPSHMAGTSAGAIVSSLRIAGYTPEELRNLASELDFRRFKDGAPWGTKAYHLFADKGIYKGEEFHNFINERLKEKGITHFGDLKTNETDPRYKYRLNVIAADVTNGRMLTLPNDAVLYDQPPEFLKVSDAVRMSMGIPGFFRPWVWNDAYIVDGGLLSNFPIWMFDSDGAPAWPTFGIILKEPDMFKPFKIRGVFSYMNAIFQTMMKAHDRRAISGQDYFNRLIMAPTGDVGTTDFNLTSAKKEWLYHSGFTSASAFLDNWSWPRYLRWAKQQRGIEE